jgi:hypothetical protein
MTDIGEIMPPRDEPLTSDLVYEFRITVLKNNWDTKLTVLFSVQRYVVRTVHRKPVRAPRPYIRSWNQDCSSRCWNLCLYENRIWKTDEILKGPRTFTARTGASQNSQDTDWYSAEGRPDDEEFDGHTDLTRVLTDIGEIMPPRFDYCLFTTWRVLDQKPPRNYRIFQGDPVEICSLSLGGVYA